MGVSKSGIELRISLLCGLQKDQALPPPFWSPNSLYRMLQCLSIESCLWSLRFLMQKIPVFPQLLQVLMLLVKFVFSGVHADLSLWLCCKNPYCCNSSLKETFWMSLVGSPLAQLFASLVGALVVSIKDPTALQPLEVKIVLWHCCSSPKV